MKCLKCGKRLRTASTRWIEETNEVQRYKKCDSCGAIYHTTEYMIEDKKHDSQIAAEQSYASAVKAVKAKSLLDELYDTFKYVDTEGVHMIINNNVETDESEIAHIKAIMDSIGG